MKQSDRYIRLKRKRKESVSQTFFGNEWCAYFNQNQFNTQAVFASTPTTQEKMSIH